MKESRSGLLSNMTKLQGEPDVLLHDVSNYDEASEKKATLANACAKCLEFCIRYSSEVPCTEGCIGSFVLHYEGTPIKGDREIPQLKLIEKAGTSY